MADSLRQLNNARITGTMLGTEDHGIFTCHIYLEWPGGGVGFGGYGLDGYVESEKRRIDTTGIGTEYIKRILETVGVENWEDLKGKYVVIETRGVGSMVTGIRNILDENKWFYPKEFFDKHAAVSDLVSKNSDTTSGPLESAQETVQ